MPDTVSWRAFGSMATLCTAQALEVLGVTVVIVALPVVGADLGLRDARLQLVVSLYAVLYGGLLLTAGRVADLVERRTVLAAGLGVTLVGAVLCATATSGTVLLAGRAVQGLGGAIVTPAALSLLTSAFPTDRLRRVAVSAWTASAAGGGALGFGLGGLLVAAAGWRAVFWLLAGVSAAVLAALWWLVPADPPRAGRRGLDVPGSLTATAGLVLLVWGAGLVGDPRAAPVPPVLAVVAGCLLLGAFVVLQRRGSAPLIAWSELTNGAFMTANGVAFVNTATTAASGTLVALVAARSLDLDPRASGLVLLPFSLAVVAGSATGGWWLRRPAALGMSAGLGTVAVAMLALAGATAARSVAGLAGAVALAGLGLSWAAVTSTSAATLALPHDRQGVASGAVNTAAQVGTALGVAVLVAVAAAVGVEGRVTGYVAAFLAAGTLAGAVAAVLFLRRADRVRPGVPARPGRGTGT
ncbi:MFS transporter [Geodermatophilus sp. DSM 44513]|uniref:MFS transporter n=1 Tax=Geodermatophilus sp. DSM 44513 TaxID=1528104 RepID=UPI001271C978|nr:MFS transporter [Geodermatophilus sp. DSM 44513]WNV73851.1 MFS transporter [Geodermatophilus sp. DSM 44513]